jgi:hypothetical protein
MARSQEWTSPMLTSLVSDVPSLLAFIGVITKQTQQVPSCPSC